LCLFFTNLFLNSGNVLFLKVKVKAHERSLTPSFVFIEVSVQRQGNARSCICVRCIDCTSFYEFIVVFRKCSDSVLCFVFHFISEITESASSNFYVGVIGGLVGVILILMVTVGILLFKRKQGNKYV
jgi:hypothetical protein